METHPYCDVLIENDGSEDDVGRDSLISLGTAVVDDGDQPIPISVLLRPLQAQLHYLAMHIHEYGFVESCMSEENVCPYYTACDLENRVSKGDVCKYEPWAHFDPTGGSNCWYTAGVAGTIGLVELYDIVFREE